MTREAVNMERTYDGYLFDFHQLAAFPEELRYCSVRVEPVCNYSSVSSL